MRKEKEGRREKKKERVKFSDLKQHCSIKFFFFNLIQNDIVLELILILIICSKRCCLSL